MLYVGNIYNQNIFTASETFTHIPVKKHTINRTNPNPPPPPPPPKKNT